MKKKHIITILMIISLLLSVIGPSVIELKPFLPVERYEEVVWGHGLSIIAYNILFFILLYEDIFSKEKEYSKMQRGFYLVAFFAFFVVCCWLRI